MKFLVAPWGWPERYEEVPYRITEMDFIRRSKTATGALQEALQPDHTILIFPDSLAVFNLKTFEQSSYMEILSELSKFLLKKFISQNPWIPHFEEERDLILLSPNVGTFVYKEKINGEFKERARLTIKGAMSDYFSWVYYHLSDFILEKLKEVDELELVLDMSHGHNFMSTLTYLALYEIGSIVELKLHQKVYLKLYNADPYAENVEFMEINLVKEVVPKMQLPRKLPTQKFLPLKVNFKDPQLSRKLSRTFSEFNDFYHNECLPFLGAFSQGIPLGIVTFFPSDTNNFKVLSQRILDEFENNISVIYQGESNFLILQRRVCFTEYFSSILFLHNLTRIISDIGIRHSNEINLMELREMARKIYKNFPVLKGRIDYEIDHLLKSELTQWRKALDWNFFSRKESGIHKRNFLAHAGLCRNCFEYKNKDGECWVRYCNSSLEIVKNYLYETVQK